jgi:hypothetical protein
MDAEVRVWDVVHRVHQSAEDQRSGQTSDANIIYSAVSRLFALRFDPMLRQGICTYQEIAVAVVDLPGRFLQTSLNTGLVNE